MDLNCNILKQARLAIKKGLNQKFQLCILEKTSERFNKKNVSVHRAPHLLCSRALEVQKVRKAYPVPRIYGTL